MPAPGTRVGHAALEGRCPSGHRPVNSQQAGACWFIGTARLGNAGAASTGCETGLWAVSLRLQNAAGSRISVSLGGAGGLQYWGDERDLVLRLLCMLYIWEFEEEAGAFQAINLCSPKLTGAGERACFLTAWRPVAAGIPPVFTSHCQCGFSACAESLGLALELSRRGCAGPGQEAVHL